MDQLCTYTDESKGVAHVRAQITPTIDSDGFIKVKVDWVRVVNNQVGEVVATEEFRLSYTRVGCSYLSRAAFNEGSFLPGTFWVDEQGKRHFIVQVEAGNIQAIGQKI